MNLDKTSARSFNSSLKKAVSELIGQKVSVEIINSYNFLKPRSNCWVRVYPEKGKEFSNEFRLAVFDACGYDRKNLLNPNDVYYGNIGSKFISAHVSEWGKLFADNVPTV